MNDLELKLKTLDSGLFSKFEDTKAEVNLLQGKYSENFATYTDHSLAHTYEVFSIASDLLTEEEIDSLNADEIYILSMACILHDIGMCIPPEKIDEVSGTKEFTDFKKSNPDSSIEDYIIDIHHLLSKDFIIKEWELLKIPSLNYAIGIGIVAAGHRKEDISDFDVYQPRFFPKSGKKFACLPYLSAVLRIADELDVTNSRTPRLLTKYYMPNNEISIREWKKHIATSQRNYVDETVVFEVTCTDQNIYAALQDQFDKIQNVINHCQKVIRSIPLIKKEIYSLSIIKIFPKYSFKGFDPKGIKFSFDVQNVVNAFIGENLYKDRFAAIREALQNSIDSCRYKSKVLKDDYKPYIKVRVTDDLLIIEDNGAGMDDFIVENFFGKLASSFYEQEKIKDHFEAIGQFGVGVFSYFLIAEYIDIETKTKKSSSLKFRFDKDPKSYFHFFDTTQRVNSGTTLTIKLKEDVKDEIKYENVEKYIRNVFKHIEIPIEVNCDNLKTEINAIPFKIDIKKEIHEKLEIRHRKNFEKLKGVDFYFNCEDYEGICAIFVGSNYLETFSVYEYFDSDAFEVVDNRAHDSQVSISQKGVFVNNYSSNYFNCIVGLVNLKKKVKINIDRNKFSDFNDLSCVFEKFEFEVVKRVFNSIQDDFKNDEEKLKVSMDFVKYYLSYFPDKNSISTDNLEFLFEVIYLKIWIKGKIEIVNLKYIQENCDIIAIAYNEDRLNKLIENGYLNILLDFIKENDDRRTPLKSIFRFLGYDCIVNYIDEEGHYIFDKSISGTEIKEARKKLHEILGYYYLDILDSNSKKLTLVVSVNASNEDEDDDEQENYLFDSRVINFNHEFIKFITNNYKEINEDLELKKRAKSVFDYVFGYRYVFDKFDKSSLATLNEMIEPFCKLGCNFEFTSDDFNKFELKSEANEIAF